jgi:hypothetical protein
MCVTLDSLPSPTCASSTGVCEQRECTRLPAQLAAAPLACCGSSSSDASSHFGKWVLLRLPHCCSEPITDAIICSSSGLEGTSQVATCR